MLRKSLRSLAQNALPALLYERLQAVRSRRHQRRILNDLGLIEAGKRYIERNGTVVRRGPFAGMVYPLDAALDRHAIPKLMGTYEQELHPILRACVSRLYECVVDIGSAEGYYAVGLARLLGIPVYAYEPEPREKRLSAEMARVNRVEHLVRMRDLFRTGDIGEFAAKRALVVCDCEGFEAQLFTGETVALIAKWDVLIELHPGTEQTLPRLAWKHPVQVTASEIRGGAPVPELEGIGDPALLLCEYRSQQQFWLWCDGDKP